MASREEDLEIAREHIAKAVANGCRLAETDHGMKLPLDSPGKLWGR